MFPRIYEERRPPLSGYESYAFSVLVNPTRAEWTDFMSGELAARCESHQALEAPQEGCEACLAATQTGRGCLGRALCAYYRKVSIDGLNFGTPAAALETIESDELPGELAEWLLMLPIELWRERRQRLLAPSMGAAAAPDAGSS